mgnify:CR=1 FL=1
MNGYIIPLLGHHRLDRLTPDLIEEAWNYLADVGNPKKDDPDPLSANTVHQTHAILRRADVQTKVHGKDVLPMAGEYTGGVLLKGIARLVEKQVASR